MRTATSPLPLPQAWILPGADTIVDAGPAPGPAPAAGPARGTRRVWGGRALVVGAVVAAAWALLASGGGVSMQAVAGSWQLLDLRVLGDDPLGSVWYLHTQPPLHNLVVGTVVSLPAPVAGTLFVLYVVCLLTTGLLLQDLLVRWRVGPLTAGAIAGFTVVNPALLDTIHHGSYEVPVATLLVGALWAAQRHLDGPTGPLPTRGGWLVLASVVLTLACLTRSLLHPVWLAGALLLVLVARQVPRRAAVVGLLLPVVLVGGWMAKNEALFGSATMSSWFGFNLQRGVVAPMERDAVRASVQDGAVSELAVRQPWGEIDAYAPLVDGCRPRHDHAAVSAPTKVVAEDGRVIANFNHECYLPLYRQAAGDALTLAREHPGRYLATRGSALALSFTSGDTCGATGCTWMDALYDPLLGQVGARVSMEGWNLPLPGLAAEPWRVDVSLVLVAAAVVVLGRGAVAAVRLGRRPRRAPGGWPTGEVLWLLAGWTVAVVVVGGDLVELGENGRFRTLVDPLLLALPLGALARRVGARRSGGGPSPWPRPSWGRRPG